MQRTWNTFPQLAGCWIMSIRRSQEMFKSNFAITDVKPIQLLGSWSLGAFLICFFSQWWRYEQGRKTILDNLFRCLGGWCLELASISVAFNSSLSICPSKWPFPFCEGTGVFFWKCQCFFFLKGHWWHWWASYPVNDVNVQREVATGGGCDWILLNGGSWWTVRPSWGRRGGLPVW